MVRDSQDVGVDLLNREGVRKFRLLHERLNGARRILLATHENPDGDGIGAMLALSLFLGKEGKYVIPFSKDGLPESLSFLPGSGAIQTVLQPHASFDLIIGLDYGDVERLHLPREFLDVSRFVTIDHHVVAHSIGDLQIVSPSFSSTSEIVYWFFHENKTPLSKEIALNLITGILVDTGGFSHITTSPRVLAVASDLLGRGVVPSRVLRDAIETRSASALKLWGNALGRIREDKEIGMLSSYISREDLVRCNATFDDVAGLISLLNTASSSRFTVLLVEYEEGVIKGSLRSERFKGVDVSQIAAQLGGGGHRYASGFTRQGTIEDILGEIKDVVREM